MGGGGNSKSQAEINAEIQMNKEMANAQAAQAAAALEAAKIQADSANKIAQAQLEASKAASEAAIKAAKMSATAGIMAASLGQNTTTEEIIRRLPVESGAATIQSYELAQQWNTNLEMTTQGYQPVAINYKTSGNSGQELHKDPVWNTLYMENQVKNAALSAAQLMGIQSSTNPYGAPITWDQFLYLNSLKRPEDMLTVDPAVTAARERDYAAWQSQMNAQGLGMIVDLYKNPQLAGQSIEGMIGEKTPVGVTFDANDNPIISGGEYPDTQYGDQIAKLKEMGIVDANNMINGGALLQYIPANLREAPKFDPLRKLSQQEVIGLQDQYNALMNKVVDPKLIKQEGLGFGVTKTTIFNNDGSVADSYLTGQMYMADGSVLPSGVLRGTRLQEWYDFQGLADKMGPSFPGMAAPTETAMREGALTTPQTNALTPPVNLNNPYAEQNQLGGAARTPTTAGPEEAGLPALTAPRPPTTTSTGGTVVKPGGSSIASLGDALMGAPTTLTADERLGAPQYTPSKETSLPVGYEGAPLAAGGD